MKKEVKRLVEFIKGSDNSLIFWNVIAMLFMLLSWTFTPLEFYFTFILIISVVSAMALFIEGQDFLKTHWWAFLAPSIWFYALFISLIMMGFFFNEVIIQPFNCWLDRCKVKNKKYERFIRNTHKGKL